MKQLNTADKKSYPVELDYIINHFANEQSEGSVSTLRGDIAAMLASGQVFTDEQMKGFSVATKNSIQRFFASVNDPSQRDLDSSANDQIRIAQLRYPPRNTTDLRERLDLVKSELVNEYKLDVVLADNVISLLGNDIQNNVSVSQCMLKMHKHQIIKGVIETEPMTDDNIEQVFAQGDVIVKALNDKINLGSDYQTVAKYEVERGGKKPHKTLFKCGSFITIDLSYICDNKFESRFVVVDPHTKTIKQITNLIYP